jgi:hypothetical protein
MISLNQASSTASCKITSLHWVNIILTSTVKKKLQTHTVHQHVIKSSFGTFLYSNNELKIDNSYQKRYVTTDININLAIQGLIILLHKDS